MQRVVDNTEDFERELLAADVLRIVRVVNQWASERPIVSHVALYGDRLRPVRFGAPPVEMAVRFDQLQMLNGFDDWIEQLRTRFAGLVGALGEPVTVLTPEMEPQWSAVIYGTELKTLATGKVRIIQALATTPAGRDPPPQTLTTNISRVASLWQQAMTLCHRCTP